MQDDLNKLRDINDEIDDILTEIVDGPETLKRRNELMNKASILIQKRNKLIDELELDKKESDGGFWG